MKKQLAVIVAILGLTSCNSEKNELSSKYADFDNMSFVYDGHLYTLGKSTLQDFLDNDVDFSETIDYDEVYECTFDGDISNQSFKCTVNDGADGFCFVNLTDRKIPKRECLLVEMWCNTTENGWKEEDKEMWERKDDKLFEFAFPCTLTGDELIENSGEPTLKKDTTELTGIPWLHYSYTKVSEEFPEFEYGFGFSICDKGVDFFQMSWLP
ncbi:hypothetical protein [Ruminococcus sp.]|uniref:hypothetical protein n=1 Tax=Ruminococcus sp. TaxID=41978 RepID=UPI0025FAB26B|nr:hypothetical protein [Ruminococcus sp.]MBR1431477.1 hypothetical protein [Ruminococcus sp.]